MRTFTLDRWNWSEKAKKWVYVSNNGNGMRKYTYKLEPPEEFVFLTQEMARINAELIHCDDHDKSIQLFKILQEYSKKMQCMGLGN